MCLPGDPANKCLYSCISAINVIVVTSVIILVVQSLRTKDTVSMLEKWETDLRLSTEIRPISYDILLHPNMDSGVFNGSVNIVVDIKSAQPYIALHIKSLNITRTRIAKAHKESAEVYIRDAFEYEKHEFWIIKPKEEFQPGHYKLHLDFNGQLTNKIVGLYSSRYIDKNGNKRVIVTSKFEPTFARQAFPCFDEPSFKANFNIKLVRPSKEFIALSNMNQESEQVDFPNVGETTVKFAKSVPMSTYLTCFIVCDFSHLQSFAVDGKFLVTVYARNNEIENMRYARDVATKVIDYYCTYFNITYPLPKLDLIAIPDFVSGAMENWGLITFRETSVLYNDRITSSKGQFRVAATVAHELTHMWFGNLVTMKWWNDLWLNEGYASYIEYKGISKVHPDWNVDALFLIYDLHPVLDLDATISSHPIVNNVTDPDQITEIFDAISYSKGAAVIRMLEATIGEEYFRQGVHSYLNSFKFDNAETSDLWHHMQRYAVGCDNVTTFMDTWTRQKGYPLITVTRSGQNVTFEQQRYLADLNTTYDKNESSFRYQWEIPITYITSKNKRSQLVWLHHTQPSVEITLPESVTWLKVNYHQTGYYRVNYHELDWYNLISLMTKDDKLPLDVEDRAGLLNDAFNLADSEVISYNIPLKLTSYLVKEDNVVPWTVAQTEFSSLRYKLKDTPAYNSSAVYIQNLVTAMEDVIFQITETSSFLERCLQAAVFKLGCSVGHQFYINSANTMFLQHLKNKDRTIKLTPDLSEAVYYYGIQSTGSTEWDKLWNIFVQEESPQEKLKLMLGLTASQDAGILQRYLSMAKSETYVRSQDFLNLLTNMEMNPVGSSVVWNFVRNEWQFLVDRYTLNDRYLGKMVLSITKNFGTEERLREMKEFFASYPDAGAGTASRKQALERVELNIKWREKHLKKLNEWFENFVNVS